MAVRTYLQGSFMATADATIRISHTDGTTFWAVSEGDTWDSADEMLAEMNGAVEASIGAGKLVFVLVPDTDAHTAKVQVDTDGSTFAVNWSFVGNGKDLRDWLGAEVDLVVAPDGYTFANPHKAGWYPAIAAQRIRRSATRRPRATMFTLAGGARTQSNPTTTDADEMDLDVVLWCDDGTGPGGGQEGLQRWEVFVDELHSESGEPFSIWHGEEGEEEQWVCRFPEGDIEVMPRLLDSSASLWEIPLTLVGVSAPW